MDLVFLEYEINIVFVMRLLDEVDFEMEEFYFEYSVDVKWLCVFNDMIMLLLCLDYMVKLMISYVIV